MLIFWTLRFRDITIFNFFSTQLKFVKIHFYLYKISARELYYDAFYDFKTIYFPLFEFSVRIASFIVEIVIQVISTRVRIENWTRSRFMLWRASGKRALSLLCFLIMQAQRNCKKITRDFIIDIAPNSRTIQLKIK